MKLMPLAAVVTAVRLRLCQVHIRTFQASRAAHTHRLFLSPGSHADRLFSHLAMKSPVCLHDSFSIQFDYCRL